ncbi:MAG: hypothetical protein U0930_04940 [Pirellulales bacterium]
MAELELSRIPSEITSRLKDLGVKIDDLEIEVRQVMSGHQITLRSDGTQLSQCAVPAFQLTLENIDNIVEKLIPK